MFAEYLLMERRRWLYLSQNTVDLKRMSIIDGAAFLKRRRSQLNSMPTVSVFQCFQFRDKPYLIYV